MSRSFPKKNITAVRPPWPAFLTYYGYPTTQDAIAREIYLPRHFGTLSMDLLLYSKAKGLDTKVVEGKLDLLKSEIQQKHPIVVFLNLGLKIFPKGHFITVIGYDDMDQIIIAHSGREPEQRIPYGRFLRAWEKTGFWTLLVNQKTTRVAHKKMSSKEIEITGHSGRYTGPFGKYQ